MNPEQLFSIAGAISMVGWLGIALLPRWTFTRDWLAPVIVPLVIGVLYVGLMLTYIDRAPAGGGFGSLAGVAALFSVEELLLAGWIHYLAFDLFVGAWEVKDAQAQGIPHLMVIPCLFLTLMAGPGGLLLYWVIRAGHGFWRNRTIAA